MKKLFAFTLTLFVLLSYFTIRPETISATETSSKNEIVVTVSEDTSTLTIKEYSIDLAFDVYNPDDEKYNPSNEYDRFPYHFAAQVNNPGYHENSVTYIGQLAHIELGTIYWESSQNFGSGKSGVVSSKNIYIPDSCLVTVNGVAYLDDNGNIISSSYGTTQKIEFRRKHMLHICANGIDLGWVCPYWLKCCK